MTERNGMFSGLMAPQRRPVLPLLAFALGMLVTLAVWQGRVSDERQRGQARFDGVVRAIQTDINDAFARYEQVLRAGQGFASGGAVGRGDWRRLLAALDLPSHCPGVKGLALVLPVADSQREGFLALRRREDAGFHIFPEGPRADYFVNTLVEPAEATAPAVGFDVGSSPPRRAALERARDTGATALTEPVALLVPSKSGSDFLLYLPVWRDGTPHGTPEERRAALTGWVGLAFNLSEVMRGITFEHPDVDIDVYVGDHREPGRQIYDSLGDEAAGGDERSLYRRDALLPVGGHFWLLSLRSTPAFEAVAAGAEPAMALASGLALSLMLAALIGLLQRSRARALALADHRAGALEDSEARYRRIIESTQEGYWELDASGRTVAVNDALCRLLGAAPEALTSQPPDAFAADPAKGEFAALFAASASSPQRSVEMLLRHRSGQPVPARFNLTAFVDSEGRVSGAFALVTDISVEQRFRHELLSSRERLRQIIGAMPFAMLITKPSEGEIVHANPHASALFGLGGNDGDEGAAPRPAEHFWLAPEDRRDFIETIWRAGRIDSRELRLRRVDGSGFRAILSAQLFVHDGDAALLVGIQDCDLLRQTEEALAAAEARARTIIDNAGIGIILVDLEGRLIEVNPAFATLTGHDAASLIGTRWVDLTHPDDRARNLALLQELVSGAIDRYELEKRIVTAQGGTLWVATVVTRVAAPDGRATMIVSLIEDITARVTAEQSLRTLWRALDAAPISVLITDVDGRIEYANPETERVTGFTQAEMIGLNPRIFQSGHTQPAVYEALWQTILSGEVWHGEMLNRRRDGSLFWESTSIAPVRDAQGRISHFVGLKQDISERRRTEEALRQSEQRFRQLFENNRAVQVLIDPASGRIVDANAAAAQYYGYSREELRRMTIFHINILPPAEVLAAMAMAREGTKDTFQFRHRLAAGEVRHVEVHAGPITVDGASVLCSIIHDVTLRQEAEAALVRAREAAETANLAKSRFLATMSHELRTPLNTILGFSEIIRDRLMGPDALPRYAEYAGDIYDSGSHLLALISDILDIAKIEAGRLEVEPVALDLAAVIPAVVRLVSVRASEAGLAILVDLPTPPPELTADPRALKQILFNLLANAIKFTPRGGRIQLSAAADGDTVRLRVRDTGIGIAADQLQRVLKPFEQVDNRYNRTGGGTGLGLSLVKSLSELHGGHMEIESVVGEGTTLTIVLPRHPVPPPAVHHR